MNEAMRAGQKCNNCDEHEAVGKWIGGGGVLGYTHGHWWWWCKCCMVTAQLEYAKKQAEAIPDLEKTLLTVTCKEAHDGE